MQRISIEQGTWYYFTVDLDFKGYAALKFERYVHANDRDAALVTFLQHKYFSTTRLILLPSNLSENYFRSGEDEILSVWTFDGSMVRDEAEVDLKTNWPHNILDKAAITPSRQTAEQWTARQNAP